MPPSFFYPTNKNTYGEIMISTFSAYRNTILAIMTAFSLSILLSGCINQLGVEDGKKVTEEASLEAQAADLYISSPSTPLLSLGEFTINKGEMRDAFLRLYRRPRRSDTTEKVADKVVKYIIAQNYLYREAVKRDIQVAPEIWARWNSIIPLWLGDYYFDRLIEDLTVDEKVLESMVPEVKAITVHQLVVADLALAHELRMRLENGEDFEELARQYGVDPTAPKGGKLTSPLISAGFDSFYERELVERIGRTEEGELTAVINHPMGYAVFRIDKKEPVTQEALLALRAKVGRDLRYSAIQSLKKTIKEKYPMSIDRDNLRNGLTGGGDGLIIAKVDEFELTFGWFRYTFETPEGLAITERVPFRRWVDLVSGFHLRLAAYNEAMQQGMETDNFVKDNVDRMKKYSLMETFREKIVADTKPTDRDLYLYYRTNYATSAEAVFSLEGVFFQGLDDAQAFARRLADGEAVDKALAGFTSKLPMERMGGTFKEAEFDEATLIVLEKTPVGDVIGPLADTKGQYAVFKLLGKSRGESPSFDSVLENLAVPAGKEKANLEEGRIIISWSKAQPVDYIQKREVIDRLIGLWLERQKLIRGLAPEDSYHQSPPSH